MTSKEAREAWLNAQIAELQSLVDECGPEDELSQIGLLSKQESFLKELEDLEAEGPEAFTDEAPVIRLVPKDTRPAPVKVIPPDDEILALLSDINELAAAGELTGVVVLAEVKEEGGEGYIVRWTNSQSLTKRLGLLELAKAQQLAEVAWGDDDEE